MDTGQEEFIETVDVRQLRNLDWPVLRVLCRGFVEHRELRQYERNLLDQHRWKMIRCVPHLAESGKASTHLYDVYGIA
jgi:hypothetical protein